MRLTVVWLSVALTDYNRIAAAANPALPRWPEDLVRRLVALRAAAQ